jgi:transposase-like protein
MGVLNELKNRGVQDILFAAADGLSVFPDAVNAVFPKADVQLCIIHMVRNSVTYIPYKERKAVTADLKEIYFAPSGRIPPAMRWNILQRNEMQNIRLFPNLGRTGGPR